MSKESKPRDLWRQLGAATHDRPSTWCTGCGYYRVVHGVHRADCTAGRHTVTQPPARTDPLIPVEAIYGGPCHCGRGFLARHDSGLCEWCTASSERNRRQTSQPADTSDPITHADAIRNITTILGGRIISEVDP